MNNIDILEEYLDKQDRKYVSEYRLMILKAIETLIAENKELKEEIEELKEERIKKNYFLEDKIQKAIDFINDENNFFEDGESWQNVLKIKEILEED